MRMFSVIIFVLLLALPAFAQTSPLAPPKLPPPTQGTVASAKNAALHVGDLAPSFALPDGDGKLVVLSEVVQRQPVVLVFYRGYW